MPGNPGNPGPPGPPGPQGPPGPPGEGVSPAAAIWVSKAILTMREPFEVRGSGFKPNEPVVLVLVIDEFLQPVIGGGRVAQVTADSGGSFQVSFPNGIGGAGATVERAPGPRGILAQGADGSRASFPVLITTTPVSTSPATSLIVLSSTGATSVAPGSTATVYGAGFNPGESVTILQTGGSGAQDKILVGGTADANGALRLTFTVAADIIPADAQGGLFSLKATGDRGSQATAPLIVARK